jgi:type I restriction enzyme S subunit
MKSNYKRIGEHIKLVDERNKGLKVKELLGLSISKQFIPSVANIIGTDMENYKIIRRKQFACSTMQVRRDKKMPIALMQEVDEAIISQAYPVFEVKDANELLPEFLMMWFNRSEFDREACFHAVGGVRGSLEWEDFENLRLPIPSISKQREIVKEYNVIQNRINLNQGLIQKLEEAAKAIYKQWFVDFEFPDERGNSYRSNGGEMVFNDELQIEIPKGWKINKVEQQFKITIGRTPPRIQDEWFNSNEESIDWISIKDIVSCGSYIFNTNEKLSKKAVTKFSIPIIPKNTTILSFKMSIGKLAITTKEMISNEAIAHFIISKDTKITTEYIYCFFDYFKFNKLGTTSSIVDSINTKIIKDIDLIVPPEIVLESFDKILKPLFKHKKIIELEVINLKEIKSILLSKLATIEN